MLNNNDNNTDPLEMLDDPALKLTEDEVERFQSAFRDPKFRDLFRDYMDEISDPAKKKQYEDEIASLELERGNKVRWVRPTPQFALWTLRSATKPLPTDLIKGGATLDIESLVTFVNLASSTELDPPMATATKRNGRAGVKWTLPHSLTSPRPDLMGSDAPPGYGMLLYFCSIFCFVDSHLRQFFLLEADAGKTCLVFDVLFHPSTFEKPELKETVISTALASIASKFQVSLNQAKAKLLDEANTKYKGAPVNTVIREPTSGAVPTASPAGGGGNAASALAALMGQSRPSTAKAAAAAPPSKAKGSFSPQPTAPAAPAAAAAAAPRLEEPQFTLTHRHLANLETLSLAPGTPAPSAKRPVSLLLRVMLPNVRKVSEIDVQFREKAIVIDVADKYYRVIPLPYNVDEEAAAAKWIANERNLELTLPVV
ncbi:pre-RNA processing PIH1/Nop17-domain-containing protein [Blastocladiella britannica]|nr:pre-RNA processing PIH1/Nop17-domain-containing protein [Blastocladiella britannica]